jgi:hypothetical protein
MCGSSLGWMTVALALLVAEDDLFEDLPPRSAQPPVTAEKTLPAPIDAGEDISATATERDTLQTLAQLMERSQQALAARRVGGDTRKVQQEIVQQLERLLAEQNVSGKSSRPAGGDGAAAAPPRRTTAAGVAETATPAGQQPAGPRSPADRATLVEQAWGHLPPQVRAALQQAGQEQFLPRYELLIEDYYRRLVAAEDTP